MKLKLLTPVLAIMCMALLPATALAEDPLYNTGFGHMAVNLGYFYGNTQITTNWDPVFPDYQTNSSGSSGSVDLTVFLGLGSNFALRWHTSYSPTAISFVDQQGNTDNLHGNFNEFDLQYRMIDDFYNLFGDAEHIIEAKNDAGKEQIMKNKRDYVAFFVGVNDWDARTNHNNDAFFSPEIGIAVSVPMGEKLTQTNRLSLALTNNFTGELGFSYEFVNNFCGTLNFVTFDSFGPKSTYYKNGLELGLSWQY